MGDINDVLIPKPLKNPPSTVLIKMSPMTNNAAKRINVFLGITEAKSKNTFSI